MSGRTLQASVKRRIGEVKYSVHLLQLACELGWSEKRGPAIKFSGWEDLPDGFVEMEADGEISEAVDEMEQFVTAIEAFPLSYMPNIEELKGTCR